MFESSLKVRLVAVLVTLAVSIARMAGAQTPAAIGVDGGTAFTLLRTSTGAVWVFGANSQGQLGDNTTTTRRLPQIVLVSNVVAVAAGSDHSLALTSAGTVYAWGDNGYGQLGDGTTTDRKTPVALSLTAVVAIAAGADHSLALTSSGDVYAWGRNTNGQLGRGNTTNGSTPQLLVSGALAIGAGDTHTLVVKTDGTVWSAGSNTYGQLGDGTTTQRTSLVAMSGISGASAVAGGTRHSVILLANGSAMAVGTNSKGQLGDGTNTARTTAVAVTAVSGLVALSSGLDHVLAASSSGELWAWGDNTYGQLGDGSTTERSTPAVVAAAPAVSIFGAGGTHSVAVTENGTVWTWGRNNSGQLGDGATTDIGVPTTISDAAYAWHVGTPNFSIAAGTYTSDRTVVVTTDTVGATIHYTQNGDEPTESDSVVSSGSSVTVSVSQTLKAKAWKADMGASGVASVEYELRASTPSNAPSGGTYSTAQNVTLTTSTNGATIRYTTDGTTPVATSTQYTGPVSIGTTTALKAVAFKTGWSPSSVRSATYTMNFGTLGSPTVSPGGGTYAGSVTVTLSAQAGSAIRYTINGSAPTASSTIYTAPLLLTQTTTIKAKAFHPDYTTSAETAATYTVAAVTPELSLSGGTYAPGTTVTISSTDESTLRLTLDGTDPTSTSAAVPSGTVMLVGGFTLKVRAFRAGVTDSAVATAAYALATPYGRGAFDAGGAHNILATPEGVLHAWGYNNLSQLGDGTATSRSAPVVIPTLTGIVDVSAGASHSLAVRADGTVWAWGSNGTGRLGDGTTTNRSRPVQIALTDVVGISAGDSHSLAVTANGQVYAWGNGGNGRLGQGTTTSSSIPLLVPGLSNVVAVAAGDTHSLAVTAGGEVFAWGLNNYGQLGLGSTTPATSPTLVTSLTDIAQLSAGTSFSLAVSRTGAVFAWGRGNDGRLGLGDTTTRHTPTMIAGIAAVQVVAGDQHAVALSTDGALRAWGGNTQGQVGDGTTTDRVSPVVVSAATGIISVAAGEGHTVLVTLGGDVWSWGAGQHGRLGDGTLVNRSTPALAWTAAGRWSPPPPVISLAPGSFTTEQITIVSSAVPNAVVRYTTNGAVPTASDLEVPVGGAISITGTTTVKARVWVDGAEPSIVASATYVLQPAAPTVTPGTGSYTGAQTVTMSAADGATIVRYTVDGSIPTENSAIYATPLNIATTTTVQARAFRATWTPSAVTTATLTMTLGTLDAPSADSLSGVYQPTHMVSLSAAPTATIRYTLDGSDPTPLSAIYTSAFGFTTGTTILKARAYQTDWAPSASFSATYVIDDIAPTIVAHVSPAANSAGWHQTPVTVSFECSDISIVTTCSSPVLVSAEGAEQAVVGIATDEAGNETTITVLVNIDRTPLSLTLDSPGNDATTESATVVVAGSATDALSGVSSATCQGGAATLIAGTISCSVPLHVGLNSIVLQASDAAGNSTSRGMRITRTAAPSTLRVTPTRRTTRAGEVLRLTVTTDVGVVAPETVTWSTTNASIVSVTTGPPEQLVAVAPGTATVTATLGSLTAEAEITVLASGPWPAGGSRWTLDPSPDTMLTLVYAQRRTATGPDLFSVEDAIDGSSHTLRALRADGSTLWTEPMPGTFSASTIPIGDVFGAVLLPILDEATYSIVGLQRMGGQGDVLPWRYNSQGSIYRIYSMSNREGSFAQGPDGTVYFVEVVPTASPNHSDGFVVGLDGVSGAVKFRIPIPPEESDTSLQGLCVQAGIEPATGRGPVVKSIAVGHDGAAYLTVSEYHMQWVPHCVSGVFSPYPVSGSGTRSWTQKALLMRVEASGASSATTLAELEFSGPDAGSTTMAEAEYPILYLGSLAFDEGGVLATWYRAYEECSGTQTNFTCSSSPVETHVSRVTESVTDHLLFTRSGDDLTIPELFPTPIELVGDNGMVVLKNQGVRSVVDAATWATGWTAPATGMAVAALLDGGLALFDESGVLTTVDSSGSVVETVALPLVGVPNQHTLGMWTGISATGALVSQVASALSESIFSYAAGQADRDGPVGQAAGTQAPKSRRFSSREAAALAALTHIYPITEVSGGLNGAEWGGLICEKSGAFEWSRMVTDLDPGTVFVPSNLCSVDNVYAAHYHAHPRADGFHTFSGPDADNADLRPGIPRYVMAPTAAGAVTTQVHKTWNTGDRTARQNICAQVSPSVWIPYTGVANTEGARCDTPLP